jgi:1-pyrroline-5-carboxylate dehydrogenase
LLLQDAELKPFVEGLKSSAIYGLHNPLYKPERYVMLGQVSDKASRYLKDPEVENFFATMIMRTSPKSYAQALGEVKICAQFLDNFSGDQVRYLASSFGSPGDHTGQFTQGYRFPFGGVALITPFNFPLEIPVLQLMGALYMGNRPVLKVRQSCVIAGIRQVVG